MELTKLLENASELEKSQPKKAQEIYEKIIAQPLKGEALNEENYKARE